MNPEKAIAEFPCFKTSSTNYMAIKLQVAVGQIGGAYKNKNGSKCPSSRMAQSFELVCLVETVRCLRNCTVCTHSHDKNNVLE